MPGIKEIATIPDRTLDDCTLDAYNRLCSRVEIARQGDGGPYAPHRHGVTPHVIQGREEKNLEERSDEVHDVPPAYDRRAATPARRRPPRPRPGDGLSRCQ